MNMNKFIFKIIVAISLLPTLGILTNCHSKTAGSTRNDNTNNRLVNSLPATDKTPSENANKIETMTTDLSKTPTVSYCDLVKNAAVYDHKIVRLRAIYFTGFEKMYLYDSRCEKGSAPEAPENVPAEMWVQWDKSLVSTGDSDEAKMNRQLNGFGRKDVTLIGKFDSTREKDDSSATNLFGHLACCRFQFLIMRVEKVENLDGKTAEIKNNYNERIKFTPAQKLEFADFSLEFSGSTMVLTGKPMPNENLPQYFFRISRGKDSIVVWGNGANDSTPLKFEFGGAKYQLESGINDLSGRLAKDELIIRKIKYSAAS